MAGEPGPDGRVCCDQDGFLPQVYWDTFNSSGNVTGYAAAGYDVSAGITPELILDATVDVLAPYDRPGDTDGSGRHP